MNSRFSKQFCVLALLLTSQLVGCSGADPIEAHVAGLNKTNIQKVANVYGLFAALKQNNGPESKAELLDFIQNELSIERNLGLMGIERDKADEYFSSSIDEQDFKIRWGVKFNPDGAAIPLVFEQTGNEDGVRRVGLSDGRILEVESNSEYENLLAGKISKADAGAASWEGGGQAEPQQPDIQ